MKTTGRQNLAAALVGLLAMAGCSSIGPAGVARDRSDYSDSIGESWKRQTLLNIVKMRYLDPPIFVDVGQIVTGYTLQAGVTAGGTIVSGPHNNLWNLAGAGTYTDRPTVTYMPLTGNKFLKSLMTPLTPQSVFSTIDSGWPADAVLFAAAASINGLKNQQSTLNGTTPPDPEFLRALALMRKIQLSGGVALRVQQDPGKKQTTLLCLRRRDISPEAAADGAELRKLLRLDPDATELKLVLSATAADDKEIAVQTRSILHLMQTMAGQIEVPAPDLAEHRATPGWESMPPGQGGVRIIEIRSSRDRPTDAFVAVHYRDHWFWVDDRDLKSKRVFAFMMMLFTLADPGESAPPPVLTIPTQ